MITNILVSVSFFTCGALCGMLFDSYMWRKMYKKNKLAVICLLEQIPYEI
jgi:uncharacterized membrane protein